MADAAVLVKSPKENIKAFNKRIAQVCQGQTVTAIDLAIAHGQPTVALVSEFDAASEQDVEEGVAAQVGDLVSEGAPLCGAVIMVRADTLKSAESTESYFERIFGVAEGSVDDITFLESEHYSWQSPPDDATSSPRVYAPERVVWALVTWAIGGEEEESKEEDAPPSKSRKKKKKSEPDVKEAEVVSE